MALRRIIEEVKRNNMTAVLVFTDFKKAFDSISREVMLRILKAYDVPPNLLRAIGAMYSGTRAKVMTPDGTSEEFDILTARGHSCPLALHSGPELRAKAGYRWTGE